MDNIVAKILPPSLPSLQGRRAFQAPKKESLSLNSFVFTVCQIKGEQHLMLGRVKDILAEKVDVWLFYPSQDCPWTYLKPLEDDIVRLSTRQLICVIEKGFVVERQRRITVNENVYNAALVFISPDMNLIANKSSSIASYEDVVATAEQSLENHNNL
ncbi:uncharacterized protein LOC134856442 [Symsagittifera roscoffensis]|uniref:uncharacterized protein LOC134856442 n=1 Tax=Symsagittifera roscoffensis TaxID=84072 RepID=UPI00307C6D6D